MKIMKKKIENNLNEYNCQISKCDLIKSKCELDINNNNNATIIKKQTTRNIIKGKRHDWSNVKPKIDTGLHKPFAPSFTTTNEINVSKQTLKRKLKLDEEDVALENTKKNEV